jgi:hypothetical protein
MNQTAKEKEDLQYGDICKSFRLMWDGFPHPVLLIQKSRNILDANVSARALGAPTGVRCRDISPYPDKCRKYCLADSALESGKFKRTLARQDGKLTATYWIPFNTVAHGLYLHFTVDIPDVPEGEVING